MLRCEVSAAVVPDHRNSGPSAPSHLMPRELGLALLERWDLAEPADGINGRNGYMVLTEKGKAGSERTDFERIRVRGLLREEMLHPLLRGRIYNYFAADDLGTAVFEAFKIVEIEVRGAGNHPEKEVG